MGDWLTEDVKRAVLTRAQPWTSGDAKVVKHVDAINCVPSQRTIQRKLDQLPTGTVFVAALPPDSKVTGRFDGCWTILHERVYNGASCLVVFKGAPIKKVYRFFVPSIWQVGDCFSMFGLFRTLKERLRHVEFYFEHDVRYVMPEAKIISPEEGVSNAWAGVINHNPTRSEISAQLRWAIHFYQCPVEIAKRMGWLPRELHVSDTLKPFPFDDVDAAWAEANVPGNGYVVVAPKSGWWPRDWDLDRVKRVAQFLDQNDIVVVLVGKEAGKFKLPDYKFKHLVDLRGKTRSIAQAAAVMSRARLVVSPDTGLVHVASSLGVDIVAPWGPSVHKLTGPIGSQAVFRSDNGCRECYSTKKFHEACGNTAECMEAITTVSVVDATAAKLGLDYDSKPTISLCMMVKNEIRMLPGCIVSACGLVDEIVVVDTGSTDGTLEWLKNQPDIETHQYDVGDEIQSFSDVRNFAFSKATSKYVIWLDACERLCDSVSLRRLVQAQRFDCYVTPIHHENIRYRREKILPRAFARFVDRVHEFMYCDGLRECVVQAEVGVDRLSYEKVNRESSDSRNIRLLKTQLGEDPNHPHRPRWLFHLGRDLADAKRYDEAIPYLRDRLALEGFHEERFAAGVRLGRILAYEKKDYDATREVADQLIKLKPLLREGWYLKAESFYWKAEYQDSLELYEKADDIVRPQDSSMWLWEEIYTWLVLDRLSRVQQALGNREAALIHARFEMKMAPPSEHAWMIERIKEVAGVPTLVSAEGQL